MFFHSNRVMEDKLSVMGDVHPDETLPFDEHDFVPHFQRVSISGEDTSGVSNTPVKIPILYICCYSFTNICYSLQ